MRRSNTPAGEDAEKVLTRAFTVVQTQSQDSPATQEAEAGGSQEPTSLNPALATQ